MKNRIKRRYEEGRGFVLYVYVDTPGHMTKYWAQEGGETHYGKLEPQWRVWATPVSRSSPKRPVIGETQWVASPASLEDTLDWLKHA